MKKTLNGITIDTSVNSKGWYITLIYNGDNSEEIDLSSMATAWLEKFLSAPDPDPEPEEDTRKWHYETFDVVEDEGNKRWFCRTCQFQYKRDIPGKRICTQCGSELVDIFHRENKIYDK